MKILKSLQELALIKDWCCQTIRFRLKETTTIWSF